MSKQTPQLSNYLLVLAYCLVLFTLVLAVGGPLTMHEGVLSQTSRQMAADHDWLVPHFGEAPWLERPPLPQWITVGITWVVGRCDQEWIVRLGSAMSGTITALLTVWLGGAFFGRVVGIMSGLVLATMYEFLRYSTLAEADIFLSPIVAGCMTLFADLEISRADTPVCHPNGEDKSVCPTESRNFFGSRPWAVLGFFVLLGMTNLAKGVVFGTAMTLIPIGGFLLANRRLGPILRYCWLWGWLVFAAIALAWPIAVYQRFPDALPLWHYDLFGRLHGGYLAEPFWYYFGNWFWVVLPWPLAALAGLKFTAKRAFTERNSAERLLWCWGLLTPLVFSLSQGKHHHYMLHFLAPWGILAALGLRRGWELVQSWPGWLRAPWLAPLALGIAGDVALYLFTPNVEGSYNFKYVVLAAWPTLICFLWWYAMHRRAQTALAGSFIVLLMLYWVGFSYKSRYLHRSNDDTAFLREARQMVADKQPLAVHAWDEALEGLRVLFYCPDNTMLLHNMTFLRDDRLTAPSVWVIARGRELPKLREYGEVDIKLVSKHSRREERPEDRWTLFEVHMRGDLQHYPNRERISPMQAMYRMPGPELGK
jgi:4-amino-4-deoxy-L-arabinose transferase-like glycosyltransferase